MILFNYYYGLLSFSSFPIEKSSWIWICISTLIEVFSNKNFIDRCLLINCNCSYHISSKAKQQPFISNKFTSVLSNNHVNGTISIIWNHHMFCTPGYRITDSSKHFFAYSYFSFMWIRFFLMETFQLYAITGSRFL